MKGKVISRTTVQHVTKYEAATDDFQRSIGNYNKFLAEAFGRGDNYYRNLYGLKRFKNNDVPKPYDTYKEAYNGSNAMIDMDDYVNNAEGEESAADSYNNYIGADLNFTDAHGNLVYGRVKKQVLKQ